MNNALPFGQYVPGKSHVHNMNAQVKIILTCVLSISVFFVRTWVGIAMCWAIVISLYALAKVPLSRTLCSLKPLVFLLAFTLIAQMFCWDLPAATEDVLELPLSTAIWSGGGLGQGLRIANTVLPTGSLGLHGGFAIYGGVGISADGLARGLFFSLRIALLLAACCLLSFTTSSVQIMSALNKLLAPLRHLGVPVDDFCLVASIALRLIPCVIMETFTVKKAQEARGARFEGKGVIRAVKAWTGVLSPLIVRLFKRADDLALALDARCYDGSNQTSLRSSSMSTHEICWLIACLIAILAVGTLF